MINNAGVSGPAHALQSPLEDFKSTVGIHLTGTSGVPNRL